MIKMNSSKLFFLMFMTVGVMLCLSSNNWIMIWCGLEISLMAMMPLISSKLIISYESMMKYFLIQSVSASMLIMGMIILLLNIKMSTYMILISICIKMGVAPFHSWVLSIIEGFNYLVVMLFLTLMKISPLMIMSYLMMNLVAITTLSMTIGSILGLNQSSNRKILVYSSIFNLGLMLSSLNNNITWVTFLIIYSMMLIMILFFMKIYNFNYINQIMINDKSLLINLTIWFTLLSMGGLPPLMGFSAKLIIIEFMLNNKLLLMLMLMILTSLLVMFYYTRMMYLSMILLSTKNKNLIYLTKNHLIKITIVNILSLPLIMTAKSMY